MEPIIGAYVGDQPRMDLYDPRLMKLLMFLTRRQAWMSPVEVSRLFHLDSRSVTSRTIHRWFLFLRESGGFVYYPYPKASVLGLQDVLVRVRGARNPAIFGVLPFGSSFNVEVLLADGQPFVTQGYWVPGSAVNAFRDYWRAARDLGLVADVKLFQSRNTHFVSSPFHEVTTPDGGALLHGPVDNRHFETLLRRNLREQFEVHVSERIAESPLVIPLVLEHIWTHFSSQQVWQAIREKGEAPILAYGGAAFARKIERPGSALRLLQQQWNSLLKDFDAVFLQPRVFFNLYALRNLTIVSMMIRVGSVERMIESAIRASEKSIVTTLKPGVGYDERCLISCFAPSDQLIALLEIMRDYHHDREPPVVAVQDLKATFAMFQTAYCKVDWRLFDPAALSWQFHGDQYLERLKGLKAAA